MERVCIIPLWRHKVWSSEHSYLFPESSEGGDEREADCRFRDESLAEDLAEREVCGSRSHVFYCG